jgi:hypothetical protein|tara:strand:- start:784 stop:942 length:159 start_codon:yes stop_codon:yes gene_type:complete
MPEGKVLDFPQNSEVDQEFLNLERQQQLIRQQAKEIIEKEVKNEFFCKTKNE